MSVGRSAFSPFVDTVTRLAQAAAESDAPSRRRRRRRVAYKQGLRLRRFLFASAFSVVYLLVLAVFHLQDKVGRDTLLEACGSSRPSC